MKKTIVNIRVLLGMFGLLVLPISIFADVVVRKDVGNQDTLIQPYVQFTSALGSVAHGDGGSYTDGLRLIHWDEVPDNVAINSLPPDFYNTTVPRGVVLSSACTLDDLKVSSISGGGFHFADYNANYATDFPHFSGSRLFSGNAGACNYIDVTFYIPGTKIPATVSGFGIIFSDVDNNQSTGFTCYGIDGKPLGARQNALGNNNGLSLLGVTYNGGERVARVRIFSGTGTLGQPDKSRGGMFDVVVMDTMMYREPRAIGQHSADFDGDGTSDFSVFRPSNGFWYALQSGSNTVSQIQFGQAGDIPVDGDFDGDSRNDQVVFRPSAGTWYTLRSSDGTLQGRQFGVSGDKPMAGDYDKDGVSDLCVWRPSDGNYYYLKSSNGQFAGIHFGLNGDIPIGTAAP